MNIAIILSGGVGSRMGIDIPKQYLEVENHPVIYYCLKTFIDNVNTDAIVVGVADEWADFVNDCLKELRPQKPFYFSKPGETRQCSIYNALKVIRKQGYDDNTIVLIHDAARPLVSHQLIDSCYEYCRGTDGVMPVIPVKDTIYYSEDGLNITSLLDRSKLKAGQAPEAFAFGKYIKIHDSMNREELLSINGSTEIAFKAGLRVKIIEGDPLNFKITTPEDLTNFVSIIKEMNGK